MLNAAKELLEHTKDRKVTFVQIEYRPGERKIQGTLEQVLPELDFFYDDGFGEQELFGVIWYADGTWSDRAESAGSEWWAYRKCPPLPER